MSCAKEDTDVRAMVACQGWRMVERWEEEREREVGRERERVGGDVYEEEFYFLSFPFFFDLCGFVCPLV